MIEYIRILNEVSGSLGVDPQSLMNIATGQSRTTKEGFPAGNRRKGQVQTGTTIIRIVGTSEPVEFDGVRSTGVQMRIDVGKIDVIDSATGKSVVPVGRPRYLQ